MVEDGVAVGDDKSDKYNVALVGRGSVVKAGSVIKSGEIVET